MRLRILDLELQQQLALIVLMLVITSDQQKSRSVTMFGSLMVTGVLLIQAQTDHLQTKEKELQHMSQVLMN